MNSVAIVKMEKFCVEMHVMSLPQHHQHILDALQESLPKYQKTTGHVVLYGDVSVVITILCLLKIIYEYIIGMQV